MKKSHNYFRYILYFLLVLFTVGCYSNRYFGTPDYFTKQPGTLILKSGEKIEGEISVNNIVGNAVVVKPFRSKKMTYHVNEVVACRLEIGVFQPMIIGREIPHFYSQPVFMERLTPDSFSISLYEAYQRLTNQNVMGNVTLSTGVEYDLEYFIHLPGDDSSVVWQLSTAVLTTHLSKGLDSLFSLCPDLAKKIKSGDPKYDIYFTPQVEISEHVVLGRLSAAGKEEKVKTIIRVFSEYERCRTAIVPN